MKMHWLLALTVLPWLFLGPARAQLLIRMDFDENCNGFFTLPDPTVRLNCAILPDPLNGRLVPSFTLPFLVTPGDLILFDNQGPVAVASDLIRFETFGSTSRLLFYSDVPEVGAVSDLSDVGIPSDRQSNVLSLVEVGSEGNNGVLYQPRPQEPGFDPTRRDTAYAIRSDVVGEPASVVILACGAGVLGLLTWWRRDRFCGTRSLPVNPRLSQYGLSFAFQQRMR